MQATAALPQLGFTLGSDGKYRPATRERGSRLDFSFAPERIEQPKATPEFQEIATSPVTPKQQNPSSFVQLLYEVSSVQTTGHLAG
jgi:hypothetical protein